VVLDEVVGMLVALSWVRPGLLSMALGFGFFRLFDILKIPPIRYLERRIPGGLGVMMDDVVAGLYAQIGLRLVLGILR
jgi:phosphatidylglycerophosphatase A